MRTKLLFILALPSMMALNAQIVAITQAATQAFANAGNQYIESRRAAERVRLRRVSALKPDLPITAKEELPKLVWTFKTNNNLNWVSASEGLMCLQDRKAIRILSRESGQLLWEKELPKLVLDPVLLENQLIYVDDKQALNLFDGMTGKEIAKVPLKVKPDAAAHSGLQIQLPVKIGPVIVASFSGKNPATRNREGIVFGISAKDGSILWTKILPNELWFPSEQFENTAILGDGKLIFGLDATNGNEIWRFQTDIASTAFDEYLSDGSLYIKVGDFLHSINPSNGKLKWKCNVLTESEIIGGENEKFLYRENRGAMFNRSTWLVCLDSTSGSKLWEVKLDKYRNEQPWIQNGQVLIQSGNALVQLNLSDGQPSWRFDINETIWGPLIPVGNTLYNFAGGMRSMKTVAVSLKDGKQIWILPTPARTSQAKLYADSKGLIVQDTLYTVACWR